jgi:hypothetical protein
MPAETTINLAGRLLTAEAAPCLCWDGQKEKRHGKQASRQELSHYFILVGHIQGL